MRKLHAELLVTAWLVIATGSFAHGQGGTARYVYDANGRLTGVIAPDGNAAIYRYDPAGNLTSIEQVGAGSLVVLSFSPQVGTIGDQVTFTGVGLDTVSTVSFSGTPAQIASASANSLVALVPQGASTGLITLSGARGSVITANAFGVVARVDIVPKLVEILPGESVQFQATVVGTPNQQVTWAVNGISGGNSSVGTIDATGNYQSPNINNGLTVAVSATSQADTAVSSQASVRILNPNTTAEIRSPGVTVALGLIAALVTESPSIAILKGNPVSVQSPSLTVEVGEIRSISSLPVSAEVGAPLTVLSVAVSETTGPVITAISPATLTRGASLAVTVTGQNLGGATAVSFVTPNGALEGNIGVTNITVSSDGTLLTFTAAIGGSATTGTDVVYVTAPNGRSLTVNTGTNTVTIQ